MFKEEMMASEDINYFIDEITSELILKVKDEMRLPLIKALRLVYGSETFCALSNPDTGLYEQSSLYLYAILREEITTGRRFVEY